MLKSDFRVNVSKLTNLASYLIEDIGEQDLKALSSRGFQGIDIESYSSLTNNKYFLLVSLPIDTIWVIKKYNLKVEIIHMDFKLVPYSKQVKIFSVPIANLGCYFSDEFQVSRGIKVSGFNISQLIHSNVITIQNILVQFDVGEEYLIFNEVVKENIFKKAKRMMKGMSV